MTALLNVAGLMTDATNRLVDALSLDKREARIEARVLLAHALEVDHAWLIAHDQDQPSPSQQSGIAELIARRAAGEPVAYILGEREFYGRTFKTTPDVLIPRPDTELLVEAALNELPHGRAARILDLGTGSGCIAISLALERPEVFVVATDIRPGALNVARENAARLKAQVEFVQSDWLANLPGRQFDLIVSNPPYIARDDPHLRQGDLRSEPASALASGCDGLDDIRKIIADAGRFLRPAGILMLEHGWDQGDAVQSLLIQAGFARTSQLTDLGGIRRIAIGVEFSSPLSHKCGISNR